MKCFLFIQCLKNVISDQINEKQSSGSYWATQTALFCIGTYIDVSFFLIAGIDFNSTTVLIAGIVWGVIGLGSDFVSLVKLLIILLFYYGDMTIFWNGQNWVGPAPPINWYMTLIEGVHECTVEHNNHDNKGERIEPH